MLCNFSPNDKLLNYLKFHIEQLINVIESTTISATPSPPPDRFTIIKSRLNTKNLTINELFAIEQELIQLYPDALLPSLYLETKDRYLRVLPNESQGKITTLDELLSTKDEQPVYRNCLITLYNSLQKYYFFINEREYFVHEMKTNFIKMLSILVIITILSNLYCQGAGGDLQLSLLIGMACAGYLGAVLSTIQRIQSMAEAPVDGTDREATLLKIYQGKRGIYLSIFLGTCAPFIIYLLLRFIPSQNGIVIFGINLFPDFTKYPSETLKNIGDLFKLSNLIQDQPADIAKILFISMISGFSERLVPDVLDRVSNELSDQYKKQAN